MWLEIQLLLYSLAPSLKLASALAYFLPNVVYLVEQLGCRILQSVRPSLAAVGKRVDNYLYALRLKLNEDVLTGHYRVAKRSKGSMMMTSISPSLIEACGAM